MSVDNERGREDFSNQGMVGVTNMKAVHKERQRGTLEFLHSVGSIVNRGSLISNYPFTS